MSDEVEHGIGYRVDVEGGVAEIDWEQAPAEGPSKGFAWIHLNLNSERARTWLAERSGLDTLVVEALLDEETRPRSVPLSGGLVLILRGVNLNPGADPEDMVSLRIWAEEGRVITARLTRLMAVQDVRHALASGRGPAAPGELLAELAHRLVERMSGVLTSLTERVDAVEETLSDIPVHAQRIELTAIRRETIALRRYLRPQREALLQLSRERLAWLSEAQRDRLREVADATTRYVEDLEDARERTAVTLEELNGRLSEQLNSRMYALSVIAGIFLPLGFITGLLGVNVAGMPGTESPVAFGLVCLGLLALAGIQIALFRRLGWL